MRMRAGLFSFRIPEASVRLGTDATTLPASASKVDVTARVSRVCLRARLLEITDAKVGHADESGGSERNHGGCRS